MRNYLLFVILTYFMATRCSKNTSAPPPAAGGKDVYIVGFTDDGSHHVAKYWKNGVGVDIIDGTKESYSSSIALAGKDVYIGGYESNDTVMWASVL